MGHYPESWSHLCVPFRSHSNTAFMVNSWCRICYSEEVNMENKKVHFFQRKYFWEQQATNAELAVMFAFIGLLIMYIVWKNI